MNFSGYTGPGRSHPEESTIKIVPGAVTFKNLETMSQVRLNRRFFSPHWSAERDLACAGLNPTSKKTSCRLKRKDFNG